MFNLYNFPSVATPGRHIKLELQSLTLTTPAILSIGQNNANTQTNQPKNLPLLRNLMTDNTLAKTPSLEGTPNFRDLGGLAAEDGRKVRNGQLFRTEGPRYLTESDIRTLHTLNIRLVCDLRSEGERRSDPNTWCDGLPIEILNFEGSADLRAAGNEAWEALRADPSAEGARRAMIHNYRAMPWVMAPHLRIMLDKIIDNDHLPALVHCTAGKDRTGFIVAAILMALGVTREAIVEDYLISARYTGLRFAGSIVETFTESFGFPPSEDTVNCMIGIDRAFLEAAIESATEEAGNIQSYLEKNLGLTPDRIERLRSRLLE